MKRTILNFLLLFASFSLPAASYQSLSLIKEKVEQYVLHSLTNHTNAKLEVSADKIDARLKLKACHDDNIDVFNPYQMSILRITTVGVRCQEPNNHWTLYVPIKITVQKPVLITKHALLKGTKIGKDDIEMMAMNISQLKQGYFNNPNEVIGQICKANIASGMTLSPVNLQVAFLVRKGERVTIQALTEVLNVSMEGVALSNGALGDTIQVKNLGSKRVIEAQVSAQKLVRVPL